MEQYRAGVRQFFSDEMLLDYLANANSSGTDNLNGTALN
jgi:hypothetical protein